ncbi:MAG: hypothetical protein H7Z42_13875 [Roseiflexaceae bacterium]|nr:hypothetical protein [Roseiflexaceae bacterium]
MHETRPMFSQLIDTDWPKRHKWLDRLLLFTALVLGALAFATLLNQPGWNLRLVQPPTIALLASAAWMLLAYTCSRFEKFAVSGWLVVLFSLVWLGIGLALSPSHTVALLPAALLPIAIALLLLGRNAVFLTAVLTIVLVALASRSMLPVLLQVPPPPVTPAALGVVVASFSVVALALILLPLRGANAALLRRLAQESAIQAQLAQEKQALALANEQAQQLAARHGQFLDVLVAQIQDGVVSVDSNGHVVRANAVAQNPAVRF